MNRHLVYPGQIPLETDLLNVAKDSYVGLAKLVEAMLGTSPLLAGFATTQTSVPSMTVQIAAGQIYSQQTVDATDYSSLGTDTATIVKQGLVLIATTPAIGTFPAPGTTGQSINYLIQIGYLSSDANSTVLPYYNSSNPTMAWSGPNNTGSSQATVRADLATISVRAGSAATTGTQTTPSPDAGHVGAYVVTVAHGDTSIVNSAISVYNNASFIGNQPAGFSLNGMAPLASPAFTGNPTAPTQSPGDDSFKLASTAYVDAAAAAAQKLTLSGSACKVVSAGGFVEIFGTTVSVGPGATVTVTFPLSWAFPTANLNVQATPIGTTGSNVVVSGVVGNLTTTGFDISNTNTVGSTTYFYRAGGH